MFWLLPIFLKIIVGDLWGSWLLKKISHKESRIERFAINYFVAAVVSVILALYFNQIYFNAVFFILLGIGFANGFAAYGQWRAIDISLSKSYLFNWGYGVIAMLLGFFILGESKFINIPIGLGIVLSLISAILFAHSGYIKHKEENNSGKTESLALYWWILLYSVIWGVTIFSMKYFALENLGVFEMMHGRYLGSLISALVLLFFIYLKQRKLGRIDSKDMISSSLIALTVMAAFAFYYWSLILAPLVIVMPIFLFSEMVLPTLVGIFGFAEGKNFSRKEWLYFGLGFLGAVLIIIGFLS